MRSKRSLLSILIVAAAACGGDSGNPTNGSTQPPPSTEPMGATITVNPATTHQTIVGWEATAQAGQFECAGWASYKDGVLDRLVNETGINRVRLEVRSGVENPTDWFARWNSGQITESQWGPHRYEIVNDNSNPYAVAPGRFQFSFIDGVIEQVVNPMRQRLAQRGEALYVNLNYVDFAQTPFEHRSNPEEYAEFMLETFQHIKSKYGWSPDAVEVILEPDNNTGWTGADVGRVIVATGDRLKAAGFSPDFIGPSTMNMTTTLSYLTHMLAVPRVKDYLTDVAYHRYGGVSTSSLQQIADRAASNGLRTAMLEHIGSGYQDLHADLAVGRNSAWQQYVLSFCGGNSSKGGAYYTVQMNGSTPTYTMGEKTRLLRQYFLFVRAGAVRVGASSGTPKLEPLAFRNTNGKFVVVVKANEAGTFHVTGVPAGTYGVKYATESKWDVNAPDVVFSATSALNASIPATGVITIYQR